MSDNFMNVVMGESSNVQIINFFSLTVKQKIAFYSILPVKISMVIITNVTGNLSWIFPKIPLIIPFDRGHEYCWPSEPSTLSFSVQ